MACAGFSAAFAADWPTFLGPARDGCSPDTGLLKQWPQEGPALLWKNENIGPGWSSVAVVNGRVYTTGNEGESQMLICLDEASGKEQWRAAQGPKSSHNKYRGARATPSCRRSAKAPHTAEMSESKRFDSFQLRICSPAAGSGTSIAATISSAARSFFM